MKTYEAVFNEEEVSGVYAISLVESPAMEGNFIALSKQEEIQFKEVDAEQRILMGLVLEPNKPIYRNQNGEEFNIVFSEQTIKELSYNFFKQKHQSNSTIEHDTKQKIAGVTFTESWIVENPTNDKSNNFGFSYPKGSWVAVMKVDDPAIWDDYVKTGKVKGFSIDAMLSLKEVNLKSEVNMSNQILEETQKSNSLLEILMSKLGLNKEEQIEVKFGMVKAKDGSIDFEYDGEELAQGVAIWVTMPDGAKMPLPVGEHETDDNRIIVVAEEGIVAEVKDAMVEEEAPAEVPAEPAQMAQPNNDAQAEAIANAVKSVLIKYSEQWDAKFSELTKANQDLKAEVLELSKQPAAKPIKSVPTQVGTKLTLTQRIQNKL
jgi:hypothetical protein